MAERYVIIGAGQAGRRAAEALRALRADIDIVLIGEEPHPPYDRPPLSKAGLASEEALRQAFPWPDSFCAERRITLRTGVAATALDRAARSVRLSDGTTLAYDRLLLATGSRVRRLALPGADDPGLFYLRTVDDARALRAALRPGAHLVVVGGGFIGLEVASTAAAELGCRVTVLEAAPRLLGRVMPPVIGDYAAALHRRQGVEVRLGVRLLGFERTAGHALRVVAADDALICDAVVVGIGVQPNVELAAAAGLEVADGIVVNEYGETADPAVFAAGDVTCHFNPILGRHLRVESWQVAENQAPLVARRMCGDAEPYAELPWLWSDQYHCNFQMLGDFHGQSAAVVRGDRGSERFAVLAVDAHGRLVGVVTVNSGRDIAAYRRLMLGCKSVPMEALADARVSLRELLAAA